MLLRKYKSSDLDVIEKVNSFCAISIRHHKGIKEENILSVIDDNEKLIGAISVWNITDKRAVTENIFVIPAYRRINIARELIATAFDELKGRGMEIATLSMRGTNLPAMKLYQSCGYSLYYNLIEMIYE